MEASHERHKIVHIHHAEDIDKRSLSRLQEKVDEYGEKYIKCRSDIQKAIETVKKNDIETEDLISRYFRQLRTAIDEGERLIIEEVKKRNKISLRCLNEQLRYRKSSCPSKFVFGCFILVCSTVL